MAARGPGIHSHVEVHAERKPEARAEHAGKLAAFNVSFFSSGRQHRGYACVGAPDHHFSCWRWSAFQLLWQVTSAGGGQGAILVTALHRDTANHDPLSVWRYSEASPSFQGMDQSNEMSIVICSLERAAGKRMCGDGIGPLRS